LQRSLFAELCGATLELARRGATPPDVIAAVARSDLRHLTRQRRVPSAGRGRVAGRPIGAATVAWLLRGAARAGAPTLVHVVLLVEASLAQAKRRGFCDGFRAPSRWGDNCAG
jgi:hypothetical protein